MAVRGLDEKSVLAFCGAGALSPTAHYVTRGDSDLLDLGQVSVLGSLRSFLGDSHVNSGRL